MNKILGFLIFITVFICDASLAVAVDGITVDKIEIYTDKSKIPDLGANGGGIPAGVKVAVIRTNNPTYSNWKFVAYGDSLDQVMSIWLTAKALNKPVNCVAEDRGNWWVQCVGVTF